MSGRLFLITVTIRDTTALSNTIRKISNQLGGYANAARVLYRFKVCGEPKVIAVYEVFNLIGMERNLNGLSTMGISDITCTPLIAYEDFAKSIGVTDYNLISTSTHEISQKELHWLEISVEQHGLCQAELMEIWRKEAIAVLTTKVKQNPEMELDLFKVCSERKVHLFTGMNAEVLDQTCMGLPIVQENGANVKVTCKAIHQLDDFCNRITTENI